MRRPIPGCHCSSPSLREIRFGRGAGSLCQRADHAYSGWSRQEIEEIARASDLNLGSAEIIDTPHSHASAHKAVELIREGRAELLMKGSLHTDELLSAVIARETGFSRTGHRLSHAFIMDVPTYHKVMIVTDAAINIAPTLEEKVDICQNAINLAIALGVEYPKVTIFAAVETANSKMSARLDAAAFCKMADRGQITGGMLHGPLAFDNAISKRPRKPKEFALLLWDTPTSSRTGSRSR